MSTNLPPLKSLKYFEVTSRLLNLNRASDELNVTPSAISKQIRVLEEFLGELLFIRDPSGFKLTTAGEKLSGSISPIFNDLTHIFENYPINNYPSQSCRITTTSSIASQVLVPLIPVMEKKFPNTEFSILTTNRLIDFSKERVDIAIRYGNGNWQGVENRLLGGSKLLAVCSPQNKIMNTDDEDKKIMQVTKFIHKEATDEWEQWLSAAKFNNLKPEPSIFFEDFNVAIKAAVEGQGVCLLPEILIKRELETGALVKFSETSIFVEKAYHIIYPNNRDLSENHSRFINWLINEINDQK